MRLARNLVCKLPYSGLRLALDHICRPHRLRRTPKKRAPWQPGYQAEFGRPMADVQPEEDEEQQPGEEQQLMAEGHDANARGDLLQAPPILFACYDKGMRMEARISAANMCLKLGQLPAREYLMEAISEYQTMLRQVHNERTLPSAARQKITELLLRKHRLSIDEAKERTGVKKGKEKLNRQSLPSGPLASKPAVTLSQTSRKLPAALTHRRLVVRRAD